MSGITSARITRTRFKHSLGRSSCRALVSMKAVAAADACTAGLAPKLPIHILRYPLPNLSLERAKSRNLEQSQSNLFLRRILRQILRMQRARPIPQRRPQLGRRRRVEALRDDDAVIIATLHDHRSLLGHNLGHRDRTVRPRTSLRFLHCRAAITLRYGAGIEARKPLG